MLIRHADNDWASSGKLAGWTSGVHLNEVGQKQAQALGERLATSHLQAVYSSPLERAVETAQAIISHYPGLEMCLDPDLGEAHFGRWTGDSIRNLARTRLWEVVQQIPSQAQFPSGERIRAMQARALGAIERIMSAHVGGKIAIVSHGDVIKAIIAHYCGMHLDMFQRLVIAPASISVVAFHAKRPMLVCLNDTNHYAETDGN